MGKTTKYKDGNIYTEDNGYRWQKYLGKDDNGKNKYKKFRAKTLYELKDKVNIYINECELRGGNVLYGSTVLFGEFAEHWLNDIERINLRPASYKTKKETYKYLIEETFKNKRITSITYAEIQNFINNLAIQDVAKTSIQKAYQFLNGCIKQFIIQYDIAFKNPCENVKIPKNAKTKKSEDLKFYKEDQVEKICTEAIRKHSTGRYCYRLGWSIILLIYTGMRREELLALKWNDINFEECKININKTTIWIDNQIIDQDATKTDSSRRIIPFSEKSKEALINLKKITGDFEHIMSTEKGTRVHPRNLDRMFRNICSAIKLEPNGVHSLRHTFASMLFARGANVQVVSKLLGHSSTTITSDIYIHLIDEQKEKAIESLDEYMF